MFAADLADLEVKQQNAVTAPDPGHAISGKLRFADGRLVDLTGSVERGAQDIYLHGPGYIVAMYVDQGSGSGDPIIEGTYFGPDGRGRLVAHLPGGTPLKVLCGSFMGDATGRWAVVVGDRTSSVAVSSQRTERSFLLLGQMKGLAAHYEADENAPEASADATFAPDRSTATGSWTADGRAGTWSASACPDLPQ